MHTIQQLDNIALNINSILANTNPFAISPYSLAELKVMKRSLEDQLKAAQRTLSLVQSFQQIANGYKAEVLEKRIAQIQANIHTINKEIIYS